MIDQKLLEACKRNDARAQRALYDLFKARLMGLCRRYSRCREDAQDMVQEAFIKIFSKIHHVESADKVESWIKSVTVRTAIDHYHKMKRIDYPDDVLEKYDIAGMDYDLVLENLSEENLIIVINELPEGCRMVFNLFAVEGYSHSEIATLLGVTEGTSRSQLHHAKYLLKLKLHRLGVTCYEKLA